MFSLICQMKTATLPNKHTCSVKKGHVANIVYYRESKTLRKRAIYRNIIGMNFIFVDFIDV